MLPPFECCGCGLPAIAETHLTLARTRFTFFTFHVYVSSSEPESLESIFYRKTFHPLSLSSPKPKGHAILPLWLSTYTYLHSIAI